MAITLKAARVNQNLTQKEAAKLLGIGVKTLQNYESGSSFPDVPIIEKIEQTYHIKYADLIFLPHCNA